ncbi:MAG: 16S rRNA (guanine(527)-N(7))-methyltransferase RsmG [Burkholderiales bacterium]|nr:16S rRNA (guanine(527)-N(7))-methyltransferase RsmG [Burkholderiales bacterium]
MNTVKSSANAGQLARGLAALHLDLDEDAQQRLLTYLALLQKWNRVYNLTAIREAGKWVSHHLLDSLSVLAHLPVGSVVDVGTGAGLPGIPLAIAEPQRRVVLLDSNHKKGAFLQQVVIECGLRNCQVHIGRAEEWQPASIFDGAISRAFSDLAGFVEATRYLVGEGGWLAAMKGVHPDEELAQLPAGVTVEKVQPLEVPGLRAARHLVLLRRNARS